MTQDAAVRPSSAIFAAAVTLTPCAPQHLDVAFTATTQDCPWPKSYGGDLVAQGAAAAMRSVTDGKTLHSTHSYFLRPVDVGAEVRYEVELVRDGRGYSNRHVRAYQGGKVVYIGLAGFAAGEAGATWDPGLAASPFDPDRPDAQDLPDPEDLPDAASYLAGRHGGTMTDGSKAYWSAGRGFDMRQVPGPVYLAVEGERAPHQAVWVKPFDALRPVDGLTAPQRDLAALAYVCDYTILEPVLRVLGLAWASPGLGTASLDHAMWFARAPRPGEVDDWLLYVQAAAAAGAGRGLGTGRFLTRDRQLLATVVQEGLIRAA